MADTKGSSLAALTGAASATGDLFLVIDISDTTQGAGGTLKNMTRAELLNALDAAGVTVNSDIGVTVQGYDADTLKADVGDVLTAGYTSDSKSLGTISSGTVTPAPGTGEENFQHYTNGGAHTLAPPASPCTVVIEVTNNASAGTITTSSFTIVDGDSLTTTDGDDFMLFIVKTQNFSTLTVKALQ